MITNFQTRIVFPMAVEWNSLGANIRKREKRKTKALIANVVRLISNRGAPFRIRRTILASFSIIIHADARSLSTTSNA